MRRARPTPRNRNYNIQDKPQLKTVYVSGNIGKQQDNIIKPKKPKTRKQLLTDINNAIRKGTIRIDVKDKEQKGGRIKFI